MDWPRTPTSCCTLADGRVLALVWADEQGDRFLARHPDGLPLTEDTIRDFTTDRLGVPAGLRERIADLPKDCGCITHDGPHWLHMDLMDRERNARLLWPPSESSYLAYAQAEARRLSALAEEMERAGLDRLGDLWRPASP